MSASDRRPLTTRSARWAAALARAISRTPITPNQISLVGIGFALAGAALLFYWPMPWGFVGAAACVQLRLLCNMLDGMVAIEGGRQSPVGTLYNELPDRIEDALLLVALGHAAGYDALGWLMALLAALTAYIRVTGGSLGFPQDFRGPQAKPHRMAVMTAALVIGAAELHWRGSSHALLAGGLVIAFGSALTCALRTRAIAAQLRARG
ncbi:MAG: CDP-alcohol phosphatidyltransferase family protein [Xanthomonadaceae bacterium]|nr:CDP-alcohol phosphatidyltransferase family protein [Xanthomonadaceae bacterium]